MIGRNDLCWCKSGKKWKKCHYPEVKLQLETTENLKSLYENRYDILFKTQEDMAGIKEACKITAEILEATCALAKVGVTTEELNRFAHQMHLDKGVIPAPLHYGEPPFPKSICTSINEVICHGIPCNYALQEGDIVNIDVSAKWKKYFGDCSKMVVIGKTDQERQNVVNTAYACLMGSIEALYPGCEVSLIGSTIEKIANLANCSVVNQFVGHGVGLRFHEGPEIPHCYNASKIKLLPGMTFTIEPMINAGVREGLVDPVDKWTARTADGLPSAQFEHTLFMTEKGVEILTPWTC
jgi:methionyl aminopeptidase